MNQQKIEIAPSSDGGHIWGHLLPIVSFCLDNGCKLDLTTPEAPFYQGRDGSAICHMVGDITTHDISEKFALPESITLNEGRISDKRSPVDIIIYSVSIYEKIVKAREESSKKRVEALVESRKRRAMREISKEPPKER